MIYFTLMLTTVHDVQRKMQYFLSSLFNFFVIWIAEHDLNYVCYLAPFSVLSFSSFVFNDRELYTDHEDPTLLICGFISSSYLAACYQSMNWETYTILQFLANVLVGRYFCKYFVFNMARLYPTMILHLVSCAQLAYTFELKEKSEFLEKRKNEELQKDLELVLDELPEGIIVATKSEQVDQSSVLLSNKEAQRLLIPERNDQFMKIMEQKKSNQTSKYLNNIINKKRLMPFMNLNTRDIPKKELKFNESEALSIQEAIDLGEVDLLYQVQDKGYTNLDKTQDDDEQVGTVVGIGLINVMFSNRTCQLIMVKNWTNYIRLQLSKQAKQIQDMMTATVSHEMRTPINAILTMIESLMLLVESPEQASMLRIIKNSAHLLLYLVNDMLDVYMIKTGKFEKILDEFIIEKEMKDLYDMFYPQAKSKSIELVLEIHHSCPVAVVSDVRRLK